MSLPPDIILPAESTLESVSRDALALVSLLLVVLFGGILKGIFYTNVVVGTDTTESDVKTNCGNCGARIPEDASVCAYCGERVVE